MKLTMELKEKPQKPFRPMLADSADLTKLRFPVVGSAKLDGIRCVIHEGKPKTRMLEDIPNLHIQKCLSDPRYANLDGEIVTFTNNVMDDFNTIQGNVMRRDGEPDFRFIVFDNFEDTERPYTERVANIKLPLLDPYASILHTVLIQDAGALAYWEAQYVSDGFEGIMLRDPHGRYKYGRSTVKEQGLLKYKRFFDAEATIIDFVEQMRNENAAEKSHVGTVKRSSAAAGKVPAGKLGALVVRNADGVEFEIGTGFTDAQRKSIWENRQAHHGMTVTYRYQELTPNNKPRFPSFLGFRFDLKVNNESRFD